MCSVSMSSQPGPNVLCHLKHVTAILFPQINSLPFILLLWIIFISILEEYFIYTVGLIPSKFYSLLGNQKFEYFHKEILFSVLFALGIAVIKGVRWFVQQQLCITCRRILGFHLHHLYFCDDHFYTYNSIEFQNERIAEQMTEDINLLCSHYSSVMTAMFIVPVVIGVYIYFVYINLGWFGPTSAIIFVVLGKILSKMVTPPVVKWSVEYERNEEDYRLLHKTIQANAESLAFVGAGELEHWKVNKQLAKVVNTQHNLFHWQLLLNIVINMFDYLGSIMSYVLLFIPVYFGDYGHLEPVGICVLISQNSFFFIYLISSLNSFLLVWEKFAQVAVSGHRLTSLLMQLDDLQRKEMQQLNSVECTDPVQMWTEEVPAEGAGWTMENVTVAVPHTNHILLQGLSLQIVAGQNLLIVGTKSSGKTSILRILRGIWPITSGRMRKTSLSASLDVVYLPQTPVFTNGCLKEQIIYPNTLADCNSDDAALMELVHLADLEGVMIRTGGLEVPIKWNWKNYLSRREQQCLCFLRALYHRPKFIVADEATDLMLTSVEVALLKRSQQLGITLVMTTANNPERLTKFHHRVIRLQGNGDWTLEESEFSACA